MGDDTAIPKNDAGASKTPPEPNTANAPQGAGIPPTASPSNAASSTSLQSDIANILGEAKLPERHGPTAMSARQPHKQYDTTLADPERPMPATAPSTPATSDPETPPQQSPSSGQAKKLSPQPSSGDLSSLHTLKDDLQHVVQQNKISYVRAVALQEEKRHRIEARNAPARARSRSFFILFVVALLVVTGALALLAVYIVTNQRGGQANAPLQSDILFAEQNVQFPIDNEAPGDVRRTLASARNSNALTLGAMLQIVPVRTRVNEENQAVVTNVPFGEFLDALGTRAPTELARALGNDFFFGLHTVDENAPVIVVPVLSYERAFAAMLAWEHTMNADLAPLFTLLSSQAVGPDGLPIAREFEDTVMRNYDVRALKDDAGVIQLYYSFPSRNILIIAESPFSFTEILSRLRADRRL